MDQFNLFEPDLELGRSLIPYGDMEIQGVWPRKQRTPSDVFPTNAALIGRGPNNDARWCATDKDGILLTNPVGGGSSGLAFPPIQNTKTQDLGATSSTGGANCILSNSTVKFILYAISICVWVDDTSGSLLKPFPLSCDIFQANKRIYALASWMVSPTTYTGTKNKTYFDFQEKWYGGVDLSWFSFNPGAEFDLAFRCADSNLSYIVGGNYTWADDNT